MSGLFSRKIVKELQNVSLDYNLEESESDSVCCIRPNGHEITLRKNNYKCYLVNPQEISLSDLSRIKGGAVGMQNESSIEPDENDSEKSREDNVESKENSAKSKENSVKSKEDSVKSKEDSVKSKEDSVKSKEDSVKSKEDSVKSKEDSVKSKEDSVKSKEDSKKSKEYSKQSKKENKSKFGLSNLQEHYNRTKSSKSGERFSSHITKSMIDNSESRDEVTSNSEIVSKETNEEEKSKTDTDSKVSNIEEKSKSKIYSKQSTDEDITKSVRSNRSKDSFSQDNNRVKKYLFRSLFGPFPDEVILDLVDKVFQLIGFESQELDEDEDI